MNTSLKHFNLVFHTCLYVKNCSDLQLWGIITVFINFCSSPPFFTSFLRKIFPKSTLTETGHLINRVFYNTVFSGFLGTLMGGLSGLRWIRGFWGASDLRLHCRIFLALGYSWTRGRRDSPGFLLIRHSDITPACIMYRTLCVALWGTWFLPHSGVQYMLIKWICGWIESSLSIQRDWRGRLEGQCLGVVGEGCCNLPGNITELGPSFWGPWCSSTWICKRKQ